MAVTAGASRSDINNLLKTEYLSVFNRAFSDKTPGWDLFKARKSVQFSGDTAKWGVHTGRNTAIGSRAELEEEPSGGYQATSQANVGPAYVYGQINLTGQTIESGKTDKAAFQRALTFEMKRLVNDMSAYFNQKMYGIAPHASDAEKSLNGVVAKVSAYNAGTATVTLTDPLGYVAGTDVPSIGGARYIRQNDKLVFGTRAELKSGGVLPSGAVGTVSSVNYASQTVTFTAAPTHAPAVGDYVVLGQKVTSHDYNKCINGLGSLIKQGGAGSDGVGATFQGITLTTSDFTSWATYGKDVNGPFNIDDLHAVTQNLMVYSSSEANCFLADWSFAREYQSQLTPDIRFDAQDPRGGYGKPSFISLGKKFDFVFDQYCPYGMVYVLEKNGIFRVNMRELGWDDLAGSVLQKKQGYDDFYATMKWYGQIGYENPNQHAYLKRITVSDTPL